MGQDHVAGIAPSGQSVGVVWCLAQQQEEKRVKIVSGIVTSDRAAVDGRHGQN